MAPKKQGKPNAFLLFAMDLQKNNSSKYRSLKEACEGAAVLWSKMSAARRKPYEDGAKQMKGDPTTTNYTSEGLAVETILKQEKEKIDASQKEKNDIQRIVTASHAKGELENKEFFVIHCNIFCYCNTSNRYYPSEITVLKFNMKNGVLPENIFHSVVESGPLPAGYKFDAKNHSETTHLLPIPFDSTAPDNQEDVYFNLKEFLQAKSKSGGKQLPILYADKKVLDVVRHILNTWSEDYEDLEGIFNVYCFQYLFHTMKIVVSGASDCIPLSLSERELEKDVYAYVHDISCKFHKATPKPQFCTQSVVTRYVYILCDTCCNDLNIERMPDQHAPASYLNFKTKTQSKKKLKSPRAPRHTASDTRESVWTWRFAPLDSDSETVTSCGSSSASLDQNFPTLNQEPPQSASGSMQTGDSTESLVIGMSAAKLHNNASQHTYKPKGRGFSRKTSSTYLLTSSGPSRQSNSTSSSVSSSSAYPPIKIGRGRGLISSSTAEVFRPGI